MRLGDSKGAIADFRTALDIDPGLRTAREGLQSLTPRGSAKPHAFSRSA